MKPQREQRLERLTDANPKLGAARPVRGVRGVSAWDHVEASGPYLGPAAYSHIKGHPAHGTTAWWIDTELDDYRLASYASRENASIAWVLAEAVIAARRAGGDWS